MSKFHDAMTYLLKNGIVDNEGNIHPVVNAERYTLVDGVRDYFNENGIDYETFSYEDLIPYLPE